MTYNHLKETKPIIGKRRKILVVGAVVMLFAGIIYGWSILKAPLGTEFGWSASQLALNFTITLCFFCFGGILASFLVKHTSVRVVLLISALLVLSGFLAVSGLSGKHIASLYFSYGMLGGLSIGMCFNTVVSSVGQWFPDSPGSCSGILMMSYGFGSLFLGKLALMLIRIPSVGWRMTFGLLGVCIAVGSFMITVPGDDDILPERKILPAKASVMKEYSTGEMLKRPSFYLFFTFTVLTAVVGNAVFSFAQDFVLSVGAEETLAATVVGFCSVCNGLGRISSGVLFDILGRRQTMILSSIITIISPAVSLLAVIYHSFALCVIGLCSIGICYGFSATITAAVIVNFYGRKHYAENYSVAVSSIIPASFATVVASRMIGKTGSFAGPFIMLIFCAFMASVLNLFIKKP